MIALGIKLGHSFHEERTEPGEEVAGNHDPRAGQGTPSPRQRRQALNEFGQVRLELVERAGRRRKIVTNTLDTNAKLLLNLAQL